MDTSDFIQEISWLVYLSDMLNIIYSDMYCFPRSDDQQSQ